MKSNIFSKRTGLFLLSVIMLTLMMSALALGGCEKKYKVIFDGNGGELVSGETVQIVKEGQDAIPPVFKREGYTFVSWDQYYIKVKRNLTIKAIWDSNFVFTSYKENGLDGFAVSGLKVVNDEWTDIVVPDEYYGKPVVGVLKSAFRNRANITSITIPNSVKFIEKGSFYGCTILRSLTLPFIGGKLYTEEQADQIKEKNETFNLEDGHFGYVFDDDSYENQGVNIPESLTTVTITDTDFIDYAAFAFCENIENVILSDNIKTLSVGAFFGCKKLTSVKLPANLEVISHQAFESCSSLNNIELPDAVKEIGYRAFKECDSLKNITLPESMENIVEQAFIMCINLAEVIVKAKTPPTAGTSMFEQGSPNLKIYVPSEAINLYKAADGWKQYANKIYAIVDAE